MVTATYVVITFLLVPCPLLPTDATVHWSIMGLMFPKNCPSGYRFGQLLIYVTCARQVARPSHTLGVHTVLVVQGG